MANSVACKRPSTADHLDRRQTVGRVNRVSQAGIEWLPILAVDIHEVTRADPLPSSTSLGVDLTSQQFGIKPAHELILLVNQDHFRCHWLVGKLKTHNDNFLAFPDQMGGSAVHADHTGSFVSFDYIRFQPCS